MNKVVIDMLKLYRIYRNVILYGIIGISAVFVDLGVYLFLYNISGAHPVVATSISVTTAMVFAFILNAYINFGTKDDLLRRLAQYATVSFLGLLASAGIIMVLTYFGMGANWAKVISLVPIVLLQYVLNRTFAFNTKESIHAITSESEPEIVSDITNEPKDIAVIGAGFTGLTAAYELSKRGHRVTVFEASDTLGGLVAGFELDGVPLEKAYHFLYKTDSEILSLADELGVGERLHFYPSSISLYYGGKLYPFMTPFDLLRFKPLSFINRIRAGLVAVYLAKQKQWYGFSQVTAMEWMIRWGGKKVTEVIWEPILRGKFFNYFDTIAMSYVWSRVYVRANSKDPGDVTEKLGYFEGGFKTFTDALVEYSRQNGVQFVTKVKLEKIARVQNRIHITSAEGTRAFDACLATTPSHVFSKLIDHSNQVTETYIQKLNSVEYLGAILMVFSTSKKFTDYYWHNINDTTHPFLVLLSLSALVGSEQLHGKHVYYVGAYVPHDHRYFSMSDAEIEALWVDGIKKVFPDFNPETITDRAIFKFKNAQHIVDANYQRKIVPYASEISGVYLANFSQIFPDDRGTNYAVAEGKKVARMIDADLKKVLQPSEE